MAENKLIIGSLPVMRGAYDNATSYYRDNQVTMYGSTFQSLADDNVGFPPAELREDGKVYAINTDKWIIVANAIDAYNAGERIANAETRIKELGEYGDSPEFIRVYTDADGKFLWGIRVDGTVEWAKGVPTPVKEALRELKDKLETQDIKSLQDAIDVINASLKPLTDTFSFVSNDEWLHAVVDAEGKLLFGIKAENGEVVMPKQDTYKVVSNDEWLAVWLDATDKILFGVKADGTFWAAKSNFTGGGNYDEQITQINNTLQQVQDQLKDIDTSGVANTVFTVIDDAEERLAVTTDKDERVISYRDKDGVLHEKKGVDTSKYYLNGKERNFVDQTEVAGFAEEAIDDAISNGDISLENINGVSNHNTPNLLIASEMQKTFNDGVNSFTPPNAGYEMSNPIECQAGDWFTRTGTATGMVVVTDENDKNGTRLFNADGSTLGSTFQIPADMTWVRYIRMAAEVVGAEDGSVVICKGKVAYTEDNRGDFLTIDKLKLQNANIPKDIKFLKSPDGKYWELYVDDSHQLQIREIDPNIIVDLPAGFPLYEITGDYGDYFDTWLSFRLPFLMERNENGVIKFYNCGDTGVSSYADFKKVKSKSGNIRYLKAFSIGSTSSNGEKLLTIYDEDFNIVDTNIASVFPWFDPHDYYYFDDNHVACFTNGNFTYNNARVPVDDNESSFIDVAHAKYFILYELKKINGEWKIIGQFNMYDYPKLFTDEISSYDDTEPTEVHPNTLFLDYDGNYIVNLRNNDTFIKIRRVENSDGTVTIGSKTLDYDEAIIGRVGGKYNSAYLDRKRVLEDGFAFTDVPTSLQERSTDEWDEWHWFHAHDVSYWGMKNIEGQSYPTYLLFDNNMWTQNGASTNYNDINERNNYQNNPNGNNDGKFVAGKSDNGGAYDTCMVSRVVQLSIDWENHLIKDYRIYQIQKKYSLTRGSAQMFDEGVLLINWSDQTECGLYDFNDEQTQVQGHTYKNGKELWHVVNQSSFRVYGLKDE